MNVGDLARPKGTDLPYQPIANEDEGLYALSWKLRGAMTGREMAHIVWYSSAELELKGAE